LKFRGDCDKCRRSNATNGKNAMPIFAYRCRACGKEFQTLVMSGETPVCKACESADLEQQLSLIASPGKGGDAGAEMAPCGAGMGACCGGGGACAFADA
jgi:putative FmdB family regulatory protein